MKSFAVVAPLLSALASAKTYQVSESYVGEDFYNGFDFQAVAE